MMIHYSQRIRWKKTHKHYVSYIIRSIYIYAEIQSKISENSISLSRSSQDKTLFCGHVYITYKSTDIAFLPFGNTAIYIRNLLYQYYLPFYELDINGLSNSCLNTVHIKVKQSQLSMFLSPA